MGFFGALFVIASVSVAACTALAWIALRVCNWRSGPQYWLPTVLLLPSLSIGLAVYLIISFEPPSTVAEHIHAVEIGPDPGPLNFLMSIVFGILLPLVYVAVAIPVTYLARKWFAPR